MTESSSPIRRTGSSTDLAVGNVARARAVIPPAFLDTPQYEDEQLNRALGRRVLMKLECCNPIRSFKVRGVAFALRHLPVGATVVCSSSGNFGQAVAYVGRARGLRVRVFTPSTVNPVKRARMLALGAAVVPVGPAGDAATAAAEAAAAEPGTHLITDGVAAELAEGAATIAEELTRAGEEVDGIVVPLGDGSLISGIGLWMREHAPATRIIGVTAAEAPAMQHGYATGTPAAVDATSDFAEGITITNPHPESLARVRALVDDVVPVGDDALRDAMGMIARHLSVVPEPAGAAGLAAIAAGRVAGDRLATLVTGANPDPAVLAGLLGDLEGGNAG